MNTEIYIKREDGTIEPISYNPQSIKEEHVLSINNATEATDEEAESYKTQLEINERAKEQVAYSFPFGLLDAGFTSDVPYSADLSILFDKAVKFGATPQPNPVTMTVTISIFKSLIDNQLTAEQIKQIEPFKIG